MGNFLQSGLVGNTQHNHFKQIKESVVNKWDELGFLEGLQGQIKENTAVLFENQAASLLSETTDANSSGSFETVAFPIVRRVFSKLLANDVVSVQAMNMPIGKLFFFIPKISDRLADGAHGSLGDKGLPTTNGVDINDNPVVYASASLQDKNLYDLYYNDGLFDHSKGKLNIITSAGADIALEAQTLGADGEFSAVTGTDVAGALRADGSLGHAIVKLTGFASAGKGRLVGADGHEIDTESFLASLKVVVNGTTFNDGDTELLFADGSEVPFRVVTQKYGKGIVSYNDVCDSNGDMFIELDLTQPQSIGATTKTNDGYVGLDSTAAVANTLIAGLLVSYAKYDSLELSTEMGEVSFELTDVVVSVEERKLRASWSPELAQDVSAFHSIDAEAELTAMLSEQVAAEIDREILLDLRKGGAFTLRWDYNGWQKVSNGSVAYTQKDWNQTLITKINQISAQIHKATLRGGANFIIVSSEVSAIFDDLEYFHVSDASAESDQYNMGIEKIGSLGGRYKVYRDPYAPADSIIIGHKGKSLLDTGYVYAPYIPLQLTPTMMNPFNMSPVKGIMTRYAKKMVNNRFYGGVKIDNVVTFNIAELR
jgi:hypothetical protein